MLEDMHELTLTHSISVDNYPMWLVAPRRLVEHDQVLLDHGTQLLDDLLSVLLDSYCGSISENNRINNYQNIFFIIKFIKRYTKKRCEEIN